MGVRTRHKPVKGDGADKGFYVFDGAVEKWSEVLRFHGRRDHHHFGTFLLGASPLPDNVLLMDSMNRLGFVRVKSSWRPMFVALGKLLNHNEGYTAGTRKNARV